MKIIIVVPLAVLRIFCEYWIIVIERKIMMSMMYREAMKGRKIVIDYAVS